MKYRTWLNDNIDSIMRLLTLGFSVVLNDEVVYG